MELAGVTMKENGVSAENRRDDTVLNALKEWMEVSGATCKVPLTH